MNIEAHRGSAFVINNETVLPDVMIIHTVSRVDVNDTLAEGADFHSYALEMLISDATLVDFLRVLGFDVALAAISYEASEQTFELAVSVEGQRWYNAQGTIGFGTPSSNSYTERYH